MTMLISDCTRTAGNHCIRKISDGIVAAICGSGQAGDCDGEGWEAQFRSPKGIAVNDAGNVFVADQDNNKVRLIFSTDWSVATVAGQGQRGHRDGHADQALFNRPEDVALGPNGEIYTADTMNHVIRRFADRATCVCVFVRVCHHQAVIALTVVLQRAADTPPCMDQPCHDCDFEWAAGSIGMERSQRLRGSLERRATRTARPAKHASAGLGALRCTRSLAASSSPSGPASRPARCDAWTWPRGPCFHCRTQTGSATAACPLEPMVS